MNNVNVSCEDLLKALDNHDESYELAKNTWEDFRKQLEDVIIVEKYGLIPWPRGRTLYDKFRWSIVFEGFDNYSKMKTFCSENRVGCPEKDVFNLMDWGRRNHYWAKTINEWTASELRNMCCVSCDGRVALDQETANKISRWLKNDW